MPTMPVTHRDYVEAHITFKPTCAGLVLQCFQQYRWAVARINDGEMVVWQYCGPCGGKKRDTIEKNAREYLNSSFLSDTVMEHRVIPTTEVPECRDGRWLFLHPKGRQKSISYEDACKVFDITDDFIWWHHKLVCQVQYPWMQCRVICNDEPPDAKKYAKDLHHRLYGSSAVLVRDEDELGFHVQFQIPCYLWLLPMCAMKGIRTKEDLFRMLWQTVGEGITRMNWVMIKEEVSIKDGAGWVMGPEIFPLPFERCTIDWQEKVQADKEWHRRLIQEGCYFA